LPGQKADTEAVYFFGVWQNVAQKKYLQNAMTELVYTEAQTFLREQFSGGHVSELTKNSTCQLQYIKMLNDKLKIKHSFQHEVGVVHREDIENLMPYMHENRKLIHNTFGLKDYSKTGDSNSYECCLKLINKMYNSWSRMQLKPETTLNATKPKKKYVLRRNGDFDYLTLLKPVAETPTENCCLIECSGGSPS
jgi:hypothetical protein